MHFMPVRTPGHEDSDDPAAPTRAPGSSILVTSVGATAIDAQLLWASRSETDCPDAELTAARPLSTQVWFWISFWDNYASRLSLPERLGVILS